MGAKSVPNGKWNIDHIIPLRYIDGNGNPPSQEEIGRRLHYKNTQPLWYEDNIKKGNRFTVSEVFTLFLSTKKGKNTRFFRPNTRLHSHSSGT